MDELFCGERVFALFHDELENLAQAHDIHSIYAQWALSGEPNLREYLLERGRYK